MQFYTSFLLVLLLACKSSKDSQQISVSEGTPIKFEQLASGAYSGISDARQVLLTSSAQWEKLWAEIHKFERPQPEMLKVDFSNRWLIACFMGTKGSGGYQLEINRIQLQKNQLAIYTTHREPGKNCIATMALTQPYMVVSIEKQKVEKTEFYTSSLKEDC